MSAARKIQDQIVGDNFTFGLWAECPEDVPVAWGARAIADRGCGFSLLPDRQTWAGPEPLRRAFSKLMNAGPLARAVEEAVDSALNAGYRTADLAGQDEKSLNTAEMLAGIVAFL